MKRKYPGIQKYVRPDRSVAWRARVNLNGRQHVGPFRATQAEASVDRERLKDDLGRRTVAGDALTLRVALSRIIAQARAAGVSELSLEADYGRVHKRLLQHFNGDAPLASIRPEDVEWFVKLRLAAKDEDGRPKRPASPNTIRQKDLAQLNRAFTLHEMPSPVKRARGLPKKIEPDMSWFSLEEAQSLIERMRTEAFFDKFGNQIEMPAREHDADLVEFFLVSGIRAHEFSRITLEDVNLTQREIKVREPKVRNQRRTIQLKGEMVEVVARLVAYAKENGSPVLATGTAHNITSNIARRWKRRLNEPRLNGRILRHTSAMLALEAGASLPEVMGHLGHKKATTTNRYVHAKEAKDGKLVSTLSGMLRRQGGASREGGGR